MIISDDQLTAIRASLDQELETTIQEMRKLDAQVRMFGQNEELAEGVDNHIGDDADIVYEQERLLTIRESLHERSLQIQAALRKIDDGTYGVCVRCGRPIAPERLEALPFVVYCIECQEIIDEGRERRH